MLQPDSVFVLINFLSLFSAVIVKGIFKNTKNIVNCPEIIKKFSNYLEEYNNSIKDFILGKISEKSLRDKKSVSIGIMYDITIHSIAFFSQLLSIIGFLIYNILINDNPTYFWIILFISITFGGFIIYYSLSFGIKKEYEKYLIPKTKKFYEISNNKFCLWLAIYFPIPNSWITISRICALILGISLVYI